MNKDFAKVEERDNCGIGAVVQIDDKRSYDTIDEALTIVEHMGHRAGKDADGKTGDGVGILTQIDHDYFRNHADITYDGKFAIAMFFMPSDRDLSSDIKKDFEKEAISHGISEVTWRDVPIRLDILGEKARNTCPYIVQSFLSRPASDIEDIDYERRLYRIRRCFEKKHTETFICSMSCKTIVYKGMFLVEQLRRFYDDLSDGLYKASIALVHSRFSTNTDPTWKRSHPYRVMMHNGEINTIKGNAAKMAARQSTTSGEIYGSDSEIFPIIDTSGSDSAMVDNTLEYLMLEGMPLEKAACTLIPQPWEHSKRLTKDIKAFYEYQSSMMEAWDGPAAVLFSDGTKFGAILDRNGLRPARYVITNDRYLLFSSEAGAWSDRSEDLISSGRLCPGKVLLVDTDKKKIIEDDIFKKSLADEHPYSKWLEDMLVTLPEIKDIREDIDEEDLVKRQIVSGMTYAAIHDYLPKIIETHSDPVIAMGKDTPLAVLDDIVHPLSDYFHQHFAQVTNPPIDSIREANVTSTRVYLGHDGNLLSTEVSPYKKLKMHHPIINKKELEAIENLSSTDFKITKLSMLYDRDDNLSDALDKLCIDASKAIADGSTLLILSDKGDTSRLMRMDSLLVIGAVNNYLVEHKLRRNAGIILETSQPIKLHDYATLIGYGAGAICPYLADMTIQQSVDTGEIDMPYEDAIDIYHKAIEKGIIKIASKMGISTIASYMGSGSGIFEAVGIGDSLIDRAFPLTASYIGGIEIEDLDNAARKLHADAYDNNIDPIITADTGEFKRRENGEKHIFDPDVIHTLQESLRKEDYSKFTEYEEKIIRNMKGITLRSQLSIKDGNKKNTNKLSSIEDILSHFQSAPMSYGALSDEAHETLARAMNALHLRSNCGEGGERASRASSDSRSAVKQVASGRFGVTLQYLVNADELQIKMAQGAKPGEGGQLPGHKVYPWVAQCRHSVPGVTLISPPPHHDIYSIEDLAQLIYNLKCANPKAQVCVKLSSQDGIGTVACGVAKAGADIITISGMDGGTGAAPDNAVFHTGIPWEIGLAQTHDALCRQGLRDRVILEVDGKLLTARDVIIGAALGAQHFAFGTAPLISMGCLMMRVCNKNTCPVGIATQNQTLRDRFAGSKERVMTFFKFLARSVSKELDKLGVSSLEDIVGDKSILMQIDRSKVDLDILLSSTTDAKVMPTIEWKKPAREYETSLVKDGMPETGMVYKIKLTNKERSFPTRFAYAIESSHPEILSDNSYIFECTGYAGESLGAFVRSGITVKLEGMANDYVGEGLSGGIIALKLPKVLQDRSSESILLGNVALYGATSGELYAAGCAAERFGVRNSGATGVVEGIGDHGCEYMTGGCVVVLGDIGDNFGAGMSGGMAYIYDPTGTNRDKVNTDTVEIASLTDEDEDKLKELIKKHISYTESAYARKILDTFDRKDFIKVIAPDYEHIVSLIKKYQKMGYDYSKASLAAFEEKEKEA